MIRTREELLNSIRARIGEDTSDEAISLLEDVTDTFDDYDSRLSDSTDWKTKYEDNDREWRQKYKDRFMGGSDDSGDGFDDDIEPQAPKTFADLFTTV